MYHIIRSVLTLHHLFLPRWEALRTMRRKIREMTNRTIIEEETVFGQPVFGLNAKELIRDVSAYWFFFHCGVLYICETNT
jgi:hypothetical protein